MEHVVRADAPLLPLDDDDDDEEEWVDAASAATESK